MALNDGLETNRRMPSLLRVTAMVGVFVGLSVSAGTAWGQARFNTMYWIDRTNDEIRRADLDGSVETVLLDGIDNVSTVAIDRDGGKIYWTDAGLDMILRANLDGTVVETIANTEIILTGGFALDTTGGKMYWTDAQLGAILRANIDGTGIEVIASSSVPGSIALDVIAGKMYWTDSEIDALQRANLDGSNVEVVVQLPVGASSALTAVATDVSGGKVYWIDRGLEEIRRANLEIPMGEMPDARSDIETLVVNVPIGIALALDIDAGKMYWIDELDHAIHRTNMEFQNSETAATRTDLEVVLTGLNGVSGLALLPCAAGDCDSDGTADTSDNCPFTVNGDQSNLDADTLGDVCDNCPFADNENQADEDDDGFGDVCDPCLNDILNDGDNDGFCPDVDNCPFAFNPLQEDIDGDGFGDACDNCPMTFNPDQLDFDGDNIGYVCEDTDGDGVLDILDNCRSVANSDQADSDCDGLGDVCDDCESDIGAGNRWCYLTLFNDPTISRTETTAGCLETIETLSGAQEVGAIAIDNAGGKMYWTDIGLHRVRRANLDGSELEDLVIAASNVEPQLIALDVPNGKVYWWGLNPFTGLNRCNLDGSDQQLIATNAELGTNMLDLDVDSATGSIYFGHTTGIRKVQPGAPAIVTDVLTGGYVSSLDIDESTNRIYWSQSGIAIYRSSLALIDPELLVSQLSFWPRSFVSVDPEGGKIYWAIATATMTGLDWQIHRANLDIPFGESPAGRSDIEDLLATPISGAIFVTSIDVAAINGGADSDGDGTPDACDACPNRKLGDVSGDAAVDLGDLSQFAGILIGDAANADELCAADINGDGAADGRDIDGFVQLLLQ